jgi:hypothetical protein
MENHSQFHQLLSEYMELVATSSGSASHDETDKIYSDLLTMIEQDIVPPNIVVDSMSHIFFQYSSLRPFLLHFMRSISFTSARKGAYSYPEFFWIIVKSNILFDNYNISDLMSVIVDFCNPQVLRAYLTYLLITSDKDKQDAIVRAFYYVGYTAESLRIVNQIVPMDENHLDLYNYIYLDVLSLIFSERAISLSLDERGWLRSFFTKGLNSRHSGIVETCKKALAQIDKK